MSPESYDSDGPLNDAKKARLKRIEIRRKKNSREDSNIKKRRIITESSTESMSMGLVGSVSVCGRRREMEDTVTVAPGFASNDSSSFDFYAVYDGHGGARVAQMCRDRLHKVLAEEIEDEEEMELEMDWEKVMCSSFGKMDHEINASEGVVEEGGLGSVKSVGSTAVVAVVESRKLVVANCGDSRAVLSRGGVAVPLSHDHKPDRPDEMERVVAAGGRVVDWNGYRVLGVLATSRSIGDYYLKPYVICEPEVTITERSKMDEFMIIATDGLWDVMSNESACEITRRCLHGHGMTRTKFQLTETVNGSGATAKAATVLVELAMARGSKDNISVVVVGLKKSSGLSC